MLIDTRGGVALKPQTTSDSNSGVIVHHIIALTKLLFGSAATSNNWKELVEQAAN